MGRVARALVLHELLERTRDRWVLVISVLFALLASAVSLYGRSAEVEVAKLTGPSLVTLVSLLVPLVAMVLSHDAIVGERERNTLGLLLSLPVSRLEVVLAKFVGRALALAVAVAAGLGLAMITSEPGGARSLWAMMGPTLILGLSFLSVGMLISACTRRQATAGRSHRPLSHSTSAVTRSCR
jgi:Cu-processing system permease protein